MSKSHSEKAQERLNAMAERAKKDPKAVDGSRYRKLVEGAMQRKQERESRESQGSNTTDGTNGAQRDSQAQNVNQVQVITGQEYLAEALKDTIFKGYYEKLQVLSSLLKIHLRPSNIPLNRRESIMTYKGFSKDIIMKYLLGIFGSFNNPDLKTEIGIKELLEEREGESDDDRAKKRFPAILCNEVLQLQRCGGNVGEIMGKFNELKARMLRLRQLWALDDITDIHRSLMKIGIVENPIDEATGKRQYKPLSYEEQLKVAGVTERVNVQERLAALAEDLAELDRMIAENQGNVPPAPNAPQNPPPTPQNPPVQAPQGPAPAPQNPAQAVNVAPQGLDLPSLMREALADQELLEAVSGLTRLFARFKDQNQDTFQLSMDINATDVAQGNLLGSAMDNAGQDNVLQFLADHFNLVSNAQLAEKAKEIFVELRNKNIL